jgi:3-deoxy-manno-octulosonate cytidylyltransferase (CMP-KDO synthetase)
MQKSCVVIPCRYQSTRFVGKPLSILNNKPLLYYPYQAAKKSRYIDEVYIATDDYRISKICRKYNLNFILTSSSHLTGTDRVAEAVSKIKKKYDIIINVQGDEPFITTNEIDKCFKEISKSSKILAVNGITKITKPEDVINPGVVKCVLNSSKDIIYLSRQAVPFPHVKVKAKIFFRQLGLYGFRNEALDIFRNKDQGILENMESIEMLRLLENRIVIKSFLTNISGIAVDTESDLSLAKKIINQKK